MTASNGSSSKLNRKNERNLAMQATAPSEAIERELRIEARPQVVFEFFTQADKIVRWMGRAATAEARPGGAFRLDYNGFDIMRGEFLEVTPHSRVVFSWGWETLADGTRPGQSKVEVTLTPDGSGTLLRLVHTGLSKMDRDSHVQGWDRFLPMLASAAESGTPAYTAEPLNEPEAFASRLNTLLVSLRETLEGASPAAASARCSGTGWPATLTAHHVLQHLNIVAFAIATAKGQRAPQADFTVEALNAYNAAFAAERAKATLAEALAALMKDGPTAVETLKTMDPASLGGALPMTFAGGALLSARQLIQGPLLANVEEHIAEIRQAVAGTRT
ncbi:MAG: hypothetical protein C0506_09880 [Anaerolinea sp.]|nr:hypothetical protein [Anaerolinea sp.]